MTSNEHATADDVMCVRKYGEGTFACRKSDLGVTRKQLKGVKKSVWLLTGQGFCEKVI